MEFFDVLFTGETLQGKEEKIKQKLVQGNYVPGLYLITLPQKGDGSLEIYQAALFIQQHFVQRDFYVAGIAMGHLEALEVLEQITTEVYEETGDADIRSYLLNSRKKGNR